MNRSLFLLFCVLALLVAASCKDSTTPSNVFDPVKQAAADEEKLVAWFAERGLKDSVTRTSSGLYYRITLRNPDGQQVLAGRKVFVRYEGKLLNDSIFDSNLKAATAFSFFPGEQSTIKAFEEGILLFRKGEQGEIYAPSGLGYGNVAQNKIPANSCLRFIIDVKNVE